MVRQLTALFLLLVTLVLSISEATSQAVTSSAVSSNTTTTTTTTEAPDDAATTDPVIDCSAPGEVYNECGPSCGDRTCENQGRNDIQCSKQCVPGCFCRNGYVRNKSSGHCILPYRCSRTA